MRENYLKRSISPKINVLLVASAWKLMKKLVKKKGKAFFLFILKLKNGSIFYKKNLKKECLFVLFKNYDYKINSENKCSTIEDLKWHIRTLFNPKHKKSNYQISNKLPKGISHNHIIHTNDKEEETLNLLKYFKLNSRSLRTIKQAFLLC